MTLLERLNDGGEVFLTPTDVAGRAVLRIAVGSPATTRADVERLWTLLRDGYDWLAADFAAAAAERAAARVAEQEAAARAVEDPISP
jgi:aromatic-L-amino-acid/L-tryptophan decarboxylase